MRILMLTQWFEPEPSFKGLQFARKLAERGHDVQVLTGFPNYPGGKLYPGYSIHVWQKEMVGGGIDVARVPLYPSHDRSGFRRALNYLSFAVSAAILGPVLRRRPDVIYAYHPPGTVGLPALLLSWWFSVPLVYDVQDLWPDTIAATGMLANRVALAVMDRVCRFVYRHADRVVVLSPGFRRALIERGVLPSSIDVIYNWAPDQIAGAPDGGDRRRGGEFRVVFAGVMGMAQALGTVLDAARECAALAPKARFVLVGGGVDRERLERRAAEMQLTNVEFVPLQPLSAMPAILKHADALLVHLKNDPLFSITIPCKTQAYLAAGRPIIMAVSGDAAELVMRAGAGVPAKPEDPHSIAQAVRRLADLPVAERERMGAAGMAFYARELSIDHAVDRFEEVFTVAAARPQRKLIRRAMDIAGAAIALILFAPLLAAAALAIRCTMRLPAIFRQERPGLNEQPFTLLKLRTMNDAQGPAGELLPDADRLTRLGRVLRESSLDELPQLWNVLRGEMSLVGPRPLLPEYLPRYNASQRRRHSVKPGITGWAQVHGRNALTWESKFALDLWYVDHQSFSLDVRILALTLLRLVRPGGINRPGHATMPAFQGTESGSVCR
jgi:lipopolysaccharide/colanic/teichoic acid biosynthesis glycosyltransferase